MINDINRWIFGGDVQAPRIRRYPEPEPARARARTPALYAQRTTAASKTSPVIRLEYVKAPVVAPLLARNRGLSVAALKALQGELQENLEGLNEMSEMTSLGLQMTMDRRSKFISTLSQMMKKISSTQDTLVQNIK